MYFQIDDAGISPTHWQACIFPELFRSKITVMHDGIDTQAICPNPLVSLVKRSTHGDPIRLLKADEVITFVDPESITLPFRSWNFQLSWRSIPG